MSQAVKPLRTGIVEVGNRAEEISRTMNEFSNHTRQIDKTMEALRAEIHEESRRLQGTGSELSRRLKLASDTVGMIEGTSPDSQRHPKSDPQTSARDRSWSPASQAHQTQSRYSQTSGPQAADSPEAPHPSNASGPDSPAEATAGLEASSNGNERDTPEGGGGRELGSSGFRLGAPRAQGPDPYSRFEGGQKEPSNVRHFPAPGRELGENLKLSGLLGRDPSDESKSTTKGSTPRKTKRRKASDARDKSSRSSDDSD